MIIKVLALFTTPKNTEDPDDLLSDLMDDVVIQEDIDEDTMETRVTKFYPTRFEFNMNDVTAINASSHKGYSSIRYTSGEAFSIKMDFKKLSRLFHLSRG